MGIKSVKDERECELGLPRVEALWNAPEGSVENDELDVLVTRIEAYEDEHYPTN
jgi:HTH-type transcriptional regulator / antitoxin HigA